jgi:hypothetical protein
MNSHSSPNPKDGEVSSTRARFLRRASSASVAAGLLLAWVIGYPSTMSADDNEPPTWSNRTLRGDYGAAIDGRIVLPSPAPNILLRGLAMTHYDGHGNFSQVDFVTANGVPETSDWRPATGTYQVNPYCTGTAEIHFDDGSASLNLRLVVVDGGRQLMTIVDGIPTGALGIKVR